MNQIIRELNAAADAIDVAAEKADGTYLPGFADGIRHATRILDDSSTDGPSEPHQKRDGIDDIENFFTIHNIDPSAATAQQIADHYDSHKIVGAKLNLQARVNEMVDRTEAYMAHGY